jgi:uncharacterized delta-60 repeat protein
MDNSKVSTPRLTGELDPVFANNGIFTFSEATYGLTLASIGKTTTARDGKVLVAAVKKAEPPLAEAYLVARLNADGTPDKRFGGNGWVSGHFAPGRPSYGGSVAITQEGKIVLSGFYYAAPFTPRRPALARYLDSGELDASFGENGIVHLDFLIPPSSNDTGNNIKQAKGGPPDTSAHTFSFSITLLADEKLLFCGVVEPIRDSSPSRMSILGRLNADGSLDTSFVTEGYIKLAGNPNTVDSHVLQPDGKILVCGQIEKDSGTTVYVRRYLQDGTLDPSFTFSNDPLSSGILAGGHITAVALHEDGRVILGANKRYYSGAQWNGVLMCLTSSGAWDPAFNKGTPVEMALGTSGFRCTLKDILIDGNGVILLGDMGNMALTRYNLDGTPDSGFGNKPGWWEYSAAETYDLSRQDDGKILATAMSTKSEKFVARFLG